MEEEEEEEELHLYYSAIIKENECLLIYRFRRELLTFSPSCRRRRPACWLAFLFGWAPADHAKTPRRALDDMMMVSRARQTFVIVLRSRRRSFPIVVSNARLRAPTSFLFSEPGGPGRKSMATIH